MVNNSTTPALTRFGIKVIWFALLLGCCLAPGYAQQADEQAIAESAELPEIGMSKKQLMTLIANEIVLAPGIGLRNVRLGESMAAVQDRLGNATSVTTQGLTGKRTNLVYKLDSGTSIVLSGERVLERISVSGNASALVRTSKGARFGMQSRLIRQIYKEPSKSRKSRLEYRQLGATFYLADDRVNRIDLYRKRG